MSQNQPIVTGVRSAVPADGVGDGELTTLVADAA